MSKYTAEDYAKADEFVRSIYPTLADSIVKEVATKILKGLPKNVRSSTPHLP